MIRMPIIRNANYLNTTLTKVIRTFLEATIYPYARAVSGQCKEVSYNMNLTQAIPRSCA